jgi:hypothetical protein
MHIKERKKSKKEEKTYEGKTNLCRRKKYEREKFV